MGEDKEQDPEAVAAVPEARGADASQLEPAIAHETSEPPSPTWPRRPRIGIVIGIAIAILGLAQWPGFFNYYWLPRPTLTIAGLISYWAAIEARTPQRRDGFQISILTVALWFVAPSVLRGLVWLRIGQGIDEQASFLWGLGVATLLLVALLWVLPRVQVRNLATPEPKDRFLAENEARRTLAQVLTGLGFLITIYTAQENLKVSQTGQITDRYTKAVGQLADQAHLEVRLGGLFSLERVSWESPTDHLAIMQLLATYAQQRLDMGEPAVDLKTNSAVKAASADVRAVFDIFRRRKDELEELERRRGAGVSLKNTDLREVDLSLLHLERSDFGGALFDGLRMPLARFSHSSFEKASMIKVQLDLAQLVGARFQQTRLDEANLTGSNFSQAQFRSCRLTRASMMGTTLTHTVFDNCDLAGAIFVNAKLQKTRFLKSDLRGAVFGLGAMEGVDFMGSNLDGAYVVGVDLSGCGGLVQTQIDGAEGDGTTKLPAGLRRPSRWPTKYKHRQAE